MTSRSGRCWASGCILAASLGLAGAAAAPVPGRAVPGTVPGAVPVSEAAAAVTATALDARLKALLDDEDGKYRNDAPPLAELRALEAGYVELIDKNRHDAHLVDNLARLYSHWGEAMKTASPAALQLVVKAGDPAALALKLYCKAGSLGGDLLLAALTQQPRAAYLWLELEDHSDGEPWRLAALEETTHLVAERGDDAAAQRFAAALFERALTHYYVRYGLAARAMRSWAGLPPAVRAIVESGESANVTYDLAGSRMPGVLEDKRLDLLLISLMNGDLAQADRWLADLHPGTVYRGAGAVQKDSFEYRLLEQWRWPLSDPFERLSAIVAADWDGGSWNLAAVALARQGDYPALVEHFDLEMLRSYASISDTPAAARTMAPPGAAAAAAAIEAEMQTVQDGVQRDAACNAEIAAASYGPDDAAPVVDRLLHAPLLTHYAEHPLPAGIAPLDGDTMVERSGAAWQAVHAPWLAHIPLPREVNGKEPRFRVVRLEASGSRVALIASSLDYGGLGYWIFLSPDSGVTWQGPYFAGVELSRDYTVYEASDLPLLAGDALQIEVERRPLPGETTCADAGSAADRTACTRQRQGFYLEVPFEVLRRDSDGDGLTDLAEEALITDPADADTDHDGTRDDADTLPQVAAGAHPSYPSRIVDMLFRVMEWDTSFGSPDGPLDAHTQFWVGDRQLFTALKQRMRFVVLTPDELGLATEKLGNFWVRYLTLFAINHSGRHVLVTWTSQVQGQTWRLDLAGDQWTCRTLNSWNF